VRPLLPHLPCGLSSWPPTDPPSPYAGLAEALRNELLLYGISVHLFLPATILSPGFENEQRLKPALTKKIEGPDEGLSPDAVAKELIKGTSSLRLSSCATEPC